VDDKTCDECGTSEVCEQAESMTPPKKLCIDCLNSYFSDREDELALGLQEEL
jgi:hypothetical protein